MFGRNTRDKESPTTTKSPTRRHGNGFHLVTWIRLHGVDIITMASAGAAALGIFYAPPAYSRYFPIRFQDGEVVYPEVAAPMQKDILPIWLCTFLAIFVPFVFFTLYQIRLRSMEHLFTTTIGLLKSLVTGALFQVIIKTLIGGPRPHFLVVCAPQVPSGMVGAGYQMLYFTREVCTGDPKDINDAMESMPSGHSTAAFAGFIYLSLYFNAQLKLISAHNPAYWKMLLFLAPILAALLIALTMTMDGYHHWYDITVGSLIGTACAFLAYRMTFASIWDFRFNHVLLPRTTSLFMRRPADTVGALSFGYELGESSQWPATRDGGWREGLELRAGAPFDAAALGSAGGNMSGGGTHNARTSGNETLTNEPPVVDRV